MASVRSGYGKHFKTCYCANIEKYVVVHKNVICEIVENNFKEQVTPQIFESLKRFVSSSFNKLKLHSYFPK